MVNPWLGMALVVAVFAGLMGGLRAYRRRRSPDGEVVRKLLHAGMGLVMLALPWLFRTAWPVLLLAGVCVAGLSALRRSVGMQHCFGGVIDGVARTSLGEIYFPLGVGLVFLLSGGDPLRFCVPVLILALADPAAALIGSRYGHTRYATVGGAKSAEGSVAFFIVALLSTQITLLLFTETGRAETILVSLTLALAATLLEAVTGWGFDNLFVPVGGFAVLSGLIELDGSALVTRLALTVLSVAVFVLVCRWRSVGRENSTSHDGFGRVLRHLGGLRQ
jgi:phytol kinase